MSDQESDTENIRKIIDRTPNEELIDLINDWGFAGSATALIDRMSKDTRKAFAEAIRERYPELFR